MIVRVELSTMFGCIVCWEIVVISDEDVCCSVVFGPLVGVSVISVISLLLVLYGHQCPNAREWSVRSHHR